MRDDIRAYGDFHGVSEADFEAIRDEIPFPQVDYANGVLRVDHEGKFIWIEDFLERMAGLLGESGWGGVDWIDHLDKTLTRYDIRGGKITSRTIDFDQALNSPFAKPIG